MAGPIYKLYIIRRLREAYYQLPPEERDRLWAHLGEVDATLGFKTIVGCDCRWWNEAYAYWGIEEYPDLQAVQKGVAGYEASDAFRYIDAETYLGTPMEGIQTSKDGSAAKLYQLFLIKNHDNNGWESLPKEERERIFSRVVESIQRHGGVMVVAGDCNWSNEEFSGFGVTAWPDVAAEQAHFKDLEEIGWHRYIYGKTILGTLSQA